MYAKNSENLGGICDRFLSPEESLLVALLENAICDAFLPPPSKKKCWAEIKLEALHWLFFDDSIEPFSLAWCFDVLNLDLDQKVKIIVRTLKHRQSLTIQKKGDKTNDGVTTN